jgi:hypothetical protein
MAFANVSIPPKYFFETASARDSYFATHLAELADGLLCAVKVGSYYQIQKYDGAGGGIVAPPQPIPAEIQELIDNLSDEIQELKDQKISKTFVSDAFGPSSGNYNLTSISLEPAEVNPLANAEFSAYFVNPDTGEAKRDVFEIAVGPGLKLSYGPGLKVSIELE